MVDEVEFSAEGFDFELNPKWSPSNITYEMLNAGDHDN